MIIDILGLNEVAKQEESLACRHWPSSEFEHCHWPVNYFFDWRTITLPFDSFSSADNEVFWIETAPLSPVGHSWTTASDTSTGNDATYTFNFF